MHRLSNAVICFRCISRKHDSLGIDASDYKLLSKDLLPPPHHFVKKSPGVLGLQLLLAGFRPYISIILLNAFYLQSWHDQENIYATL